MVYPQYVNGLGEGGSTVETDSTGLFKATFASLFQTNVSGKKQIARGGEEGGQIPSESGPSIIHIIIIELKPI